MRIRLLFILTTLMLVPVVFHSCGKHKSMIADTPVITGTAVAEADTGLYVYGIPADNFDLIPGQFRRNSFLSEILLDHGVGMNEIDQVIRNSAAVFDVRKIRSGNNYTLFCTRDSVPRAKYLLYEHDPVTVYVFSFSDSLNITMFNKEITSVIRFSKGTIETSLWDAMVTNDLHPVLASQLSEIYAWTIDFFSLQKGDSFRVVHEELFIDGRSLGPGRIYGARFTWSGTTIDAIPFIQDSTESYYDTSGNSLRKAFLKAPLEFSRISSRYSGSRLHPVLRIRRPHLGVDYAAPSGTPVRAVGDGRVTSAAYSGESGNMVRIVHNSIYSTAYLHLSRFGSGIRSGSMVKQGQVIGYVGSTGLATGPHLDFRFYKNGSPVDPLKVEAPPVEPVLEVNRERFEKLRMVAGSLLDSF